MRKKKDLPLVILKSLEPYVNLKGDKFEVVDPKESLLKVIDKDSESSFYFAIDKYQKDNNGKFQFLMNRIPRSANDNGVYETWVEISGLAGQFEAWVKLLNEYETVNSFFDDPVIDTYTEEFYADFEIVDEESETKPFSIKQVILLDSHLDELSNGLESLKDKDNHDQIDFIKAEIEELKESLTSKSKKWVIKRLSKIWARIVKQGPKFMKSILDESKKEVIKQGVKFVFEKGIENL